MKKHMQKTEPTLPFPSPPLLFLWSFWIVHFPCTCSIYCYEVWRLDSWFVAFCFWKLKQLCCESDFMILQNKPVLDGSHCPGEARHNGDSTAWKQTRQSGKSERYTHSSAIFVPKLKPFRDSVVCLITPSPTWSKHHKWPWETCWYSLKPGRCMGRLTLW